MNNSGILISNATIINENECFKGSILLKDKIIHKIYRNGETPAPDGQYTVIDAAGKIVIPGAIDDQVHFREPGNTHKGDIASESRAAVAGGVTTFMDMPNNNPPTCSVAELERKYGIASSVSPANYAFYLGASNSNIDEVLSADPSLYCGIKVFMGSSTGNMLVDDPQVLEKLFANAKKVVATHCEEESIVRANLQAAIAQYGEEIPVRLHPEIRSRKACICSTAKALYLAMKYGTRLHVLHISTEDEVEMIRLAQRTNPLISGEICVHYLFFNDSMYDRFGTRIKCNPAIKSESDMAALRKAVREGTIRVVATDHAPHLPSEKSGAYTKAASGLPLVQHSLAMMLELAYRGILSGEGKDRLDMVNAATGSATDTAQGIPADFTSETFLEGAKTVVDRMCHAPAEKFGIKGRGYLREGYYADITIIKPAADRIKPVYKCGWATVEDFVFHTAVDTVLVNGQVVVSGGKPVENMPAAGMKVEYR